MNSKKLWTKQEYFDFRDKRNAIRDAHDKEGSFMKRRRMLTEIKSMDVQLTEHEIMFPSHKNEYRQVIINQDERNTEF